MIKSRERNGKELHELTMTKLIEEFRAMNIEGGKFAMNVLGLNLSEEQTKILESRCKEFEDYQKEVAFEFVSRFIK